METAALAKLFLSEQGFALVIATSIFIATLILVVKKRIGIILTTILLLFSLLSGLAISNQHSFREYLTIRAQYDSDAEKLKILHFKKEMIKAYDDLRSEWQVQRQNILDLIDEVHEEVIIGHS